MLVNSPKNTIRKIENVWAFVSVDPEDNTEGLCAAPMGGTTLPMIAADEQRLEMLKPIAAQLAKMSGMKIKLVRLTGRVEEEEFLPSETKETGWKHPCSVCFTPDACRSWQRCAAVPHPKE